MKPGSARRVAQGGFALIEVLVTLVILMVGLLGLVGLMVQSQRSQMESYQRVQAVVVVQDMVNRINANRKAAGCYAITTNADGTPYMGKDSSVTPACATGTAQQQARAIADLTEWNNVLLGVAEKSGGNNVGVMLGARGCIELVSPGVYRVSVAWQGTGRTAAPSAEACGSGLYGDEAQRRVVSVPLKIAVLS